MGVKLYPKTKPAKPRGDFGVCDIEARKGTWIDFLTIGFYDGKSFLHFEDLQVFLDYVRNNFNGNDIYAHFGGKYDFNFIIGAAILNARCEVRNLIPRGSGILCFELLFLDDKGNPFKKVSMRDSSGLLPMGLANLTKSFDVEHKKGVIDYLKIDKITPELLEYLESDCRGLYEVLDKYNHWPLIEFAGGAYTMASQAMKVLRTFLEEPLNSCPDRIDAFVRKGYFGGRTEIFRPLFNDSKQSLKVFDVNSLYPFVMRTFEMPGTFKSMTSYYDASSFGFWDCEVDIPEMYIPPLPAVVEVDTKIKKTKSKKAKKKRKKDEFHFKQTKKLIFATGKKIRGTWATCELEYAKTLGVKIVKVYKGATFHSAGFIFREYIDTLYKMRLEAKAEKNGVSDLLCKLLMNSCYGRMALRKESETLSIFSGDEGNDFKTHSEFKMGDNWVRIMKKKEELDKSFSNVAISAWVTAQARIHLHKILMKCKDTVYYCDTDSIFTSETLPTGKELGALKEEYRCKAACFLLPKTYAMTAEGDYKFEVIGRDGKKTLRSKKVVMKGFDKKKIGNFTVGDFAMALEGDLRRLKVMQEPKFATFKSAIKRGAFLKLLPKSPREIRTMYDKRKIIKVGDSYDTKPLHLEAK